MMGEVGNTVGKLSAGEEKNVNHSTIKTEIIETSARASRISSFRRETSRLRQQTLLGGATPTSQRQSQLFRFLRQCEMITDQVKSQQSRNRAKAD